MNKKDFYEVTPFGDDIDESLRVPVECEKGYKKLCKQCKRKTPEVMKSFIEDEVSCDDELYYCFWCDFIADTEIDESIMKQNAEAGSILENRDYDEDNGEDAMWELEDSGAFSDEGIMAGCNSGCLEYEMEAKSIAKEIEGMRFEGELIRTAREKAGISIEELAKSLSLPESYISNIEEGCHLSRCTNMDIEDIDVLLPVQDRCTSNKREWWHDCSDFEIKKKIAQYISDVICPPDNTKHKTDEFMAGIIQNDFIEATQSVLENNLMTMGLLQRTFGLGARPVYMIMNILQEAGVDVDFPEKSAPAIMDLDEETLKVFKDVGWSDEDIASLRVSDNLLELYNKIEAINKKYADK